MNFINGSIFWQMNVFIISLCDEMNGEVRWGLLAALKRNFFFFCAIKISPNLRVRKNQWVSNHQRCFFANQVHSKFSLIQTEQQFFLKGKSVVLCLLDEPLWWLSTEWWRRKKKHWRKKVKCQVGFKPLTSWSQGKHSKAVLQLLLGNESMNITYCHSVQTFIELTCFHLLFKDDFFWNGHGSNVLQA